MSIVERRLAGRFLCADLVSVAWGTEKAHAVLEDISALGACVQVEVAIPLGSAITLSIGESHFSGHVSYSVCRDYGRFVGIRYSGDTEWSAEKVRPLHLTDLGALGFTEPA